MFQKTHNNFIKLYDKSLDIFKQSSKKTKTEVKNIFSISQKKIKELKFEERKQQREMLKNEFTQELKFSGKFLVTALLISIILKILLENIEFIDIYLIHFENIIFILFYDSFLSKLFFLITILFLGFFLFHGLKYLYDLSRKNEVRFFHVCFLLIFLILIFFKTFFVLFLIFLIIESVIYGLLFLKQSKKPKRQIEKNESILISDKAIKNKLDDKLGVFERAQKFFDILLNGNSPENQVFGLVAEWGTGKTSFLNFLTRESIHYSQFGGNPSNKDKIIFVKFNPWYYEGESELLEKLFDEIIGTLKKDYYVGNLGRNFSKLGKLLDDNSSHFLGFSFPFSSLFFSPTSLHKLKEDIKENIEKIDKKIVIIIDDLDRVTSDKFIEILKIVDLTRDFYNTSFILCYDPQNFNVIDSKLIQTLRNEGENIKHIDSQSFDNTELTKYMGKIVTSRYSIHIHKKDIEKEFKRIIFDKKIKGFEFGPYSVKAIEISISKLFEYENYIIWGKYLSNLRDLKRCINFLISIIYSSIKNKNEIDCNEVEYFDEILGLRFDLFIKLCLFQMHHYNLYKDIENEITISDSIYGNDSKYLLDGYISDKEEKIRYTEYLKGLKISEHRLLTDLFPIYLKNSSGFNYEKKYQLREFQNLKPYIDLLTGNFSEVESDIVNNRYLINLINKYLKEGLEGEIVIDEIYTRGKIALINNFLNKFPDLINKLKDSKQKITLSFNMINSIIHKKELYKFYENDFSFYIDIARILDSSVTSNMNKDISHISDFVYGKGEYKKALPIKIFEISRKFGEEETVNGFAEGLRLLLAADTSRGGSFFNFDRAVHVENLYTIIYNYYVENYINSEQNFIEYIYNFEENYDEKILGHLLYMLLNYAPSEKKQSLTKYFIKGFKLNQEYIFNWIIRHIDDGFHREPQIIMGEVVEYFDKEIFENYLKENNVDFKKWMKKKGNEKVIVSSKYSGHEKMIFTYRELLEKYEKSYENYFLKKENNDLQ